MKRAVDCAFGLLGLAVLTVPFLVIAAAIVLDSRGGVFFRQERVGRGGRTFGIWKFRTMVKDAASKGLGVTVSATDARITRVGRLLRNWGIDELPQLLNVLAGQMSLVGPRPTLAYQVEAYDAEQRRRLEMKPGITSLAVISGRNAISWERRIELDIWYVDHWSLGLDLRIMAKTLWVVLVTREGLYGEDGVNDPFVAQPGMGVSQDGRPREHRK
jgi:lipopolysaccharide/colanic/teichoic acid biosynthesis glycosyltransferase